MSNIEPTEEHYDAVCRFLSKEIDNGDNVRVEALAQLLAEREAKLREEVATLNFNNDQLVCALDEGGFCYPASNVPCFIVHDRLESSGDWYDPVTSRILHMDPAKAFAMKDENTTLRARVAELEASVAEITRQRITETQRRMSAEASYQDRVAELEEIAADLRGDIESDVEKHKREVEVLTKRVAELEAEIEALQEPPKRHVFWGAGEPDCPAHLKTPRGELHTFQCKICGGSERTPACIRDENQAGRRRDVGVQTMERLCLGAYAREVEAVVAHNAMARHAVDLEKRVAELEAREKFRALAADVYRLSK